MSKMTSNAPKNVGKHVTSNIMCRDVMYFSAFLSNMMSLQMVQQMGCQYVHLQTD